MTATTLDPVPTATATVRSEDGPVGLEELRRSVRDLGECLAELPSTDPRWQVLGVSVSAVADLVRRSLAERGTTASGDLAPIVRLRDLAVTSRSLLRRDVTIVDPAAAQDARRRCVHIVMTLGLNGDARSCRPEPS